MADPERTIPPSEGRAQKIIDDLNRGEGALARWIGLLAAKLAQHPHAALVLFIGYTVSIVWLGFKVGQP